MNTPNQTWVVKKIIPTTTIQEYHVNATSYQDAINKLKDKGGDAVNVTVITHDIDTEFTVDKMG